MTHGFTCPDWQAHLRDPTTLLYKVLMAEPFSRGNGRIEVESLALFGVMHCQGTPDEKMHVFSKVLFGGQQRMI
jgi:hypothetical protein